MSLFGLYITEDVCPCFLISAQKCKNHCNHTKWFLFLEQLKRAKKKLFLKKLPIYNGKDYLTEKNMIKLSTHKMLDFKNHDLEKYFIEGSLHWKQ